MQKCEVTSLFSYTKAVIDTIKNKPKKNLKTIYSLNLKIVAI